MFENVKTALNRVFGPVVPASTRASEGRVPHAGNLRDPQGRNIPIPHIKREWGRTRDIGTLPSVVGDITGTSGPRRTMFPQIINPQLFQESQRSRPLRSDGEILAQAVNFNESEVVAMDPRSRGVASSHPRRQCHSREERLARAGPSEVHSVALDSTRKHPRGSTDVISKYPQSRDETPPLPPFRFGSAVYQGERVTLAEFALRRIRSVL